MNLPPIRTTDIVVQSAGKELLVYDLQSHQAYQLNETSRIVYQACADGQSFEDLRRKYKSDDLIYLALDKLCSLNLIGSDYQPKLASLPRRELIKKIGLASAVALPLVVSVVVPQAIHAQSCVNSGGAAAGTRVEATTTNPFDDTEANQNYAAQFLVAQCCSNRYRDFQSTGCSAGAGQTCFTFAYCI
jgi:hypothetical protein